ncbi:PREDICTED: uncharacterized protein LOC104595565 [Nelumbo nucifera]|uniref:Uncharacterized protein LOC104595565 n=1 Tax=Nelumbo nucifera TaxID=4432 RepID=A0A1U7ZRK4_NELNU|nr:PREDICTED: uncharacterized protein LOC104595565 [Nelumbo nucifera]
MENYSYSYPDSSNSSPRSREIDSENPLWEDLPNYKIRFMCSYGGKIQPRPHDNQLAYIGGDTKILSVDRGIRFSALISKLSSLCASDVELSLFKYQLPGEDLDALISVTNDEDLEHMMLEYDRLHRASAKPARLRLFLFPHNPSPQNAFASNEPKTDSEWFVDALNNVPIQSLDASSPPAPSIQNNPDFLFGLDKGSAIQPQPPPAAKPTIPEPDLPEVPAPEIPIGTDSCRYDRRMAAEPIAPSIEIQRQIQELKRLQIAEQEQNVYQKQSEENLAKAFPGELYVQKIPEKTAPVPSPVPVTVPHPASYWPERHMTTAPYQPTTVTGEHPVYLIPTPAGVYHAPAAHPIAGQVGQGYYAMPRVLQDVYREPQVYSVGPPAAQPAKVGMYKEGGVGIVRPAAGAAAMAEAGYAQVAYDSAGRQVYYTTTAPGMVPNYQTVTAARIDVRQGGAATPAVVSQEAGKMGGKPSQGSL